MLKCLCFLFLKACSLVGYFNSSTNVTEQLLVVKGCQNPVLFSTPRDAMQCSTVVQCSAVQCSVIKYCKTAAMSPTLLVCSLPPFLHWSISPPPSFPGSLQPSLIQLPDSFPLQQPQFLMIYMFRPLLTLSNTFSFPFFPLAPLLPPFPRLSIGGALASSEEYQLLCSCLITISHVFSWHCFQASREFCHWDAFRVLSHFVSLKTTYWLAKDGRHLKSVELYIQHSSFRL